MRCILTAIGIPHVEKYKKFQKDRKERGKIILVIFHGAIVESITSALVSTSASASLPGLWVSNCF